MKRKKSGGAYRKEKLIITASSVLVLAAMTVTGVFIYNNSQTEVPEDNVVDFSVLENSIGESEPEVAQAENQSAQNLTSGQENTGELDYDPYYAQQDRELNEQEVNAGAKKAEESQEQESETGESAVSIEEDQEKNVGYAEISGESVVSSADNSAEMNEDIAAVHVPEASDGEEDIAAADVSEAQDALAAVADVVQEEVNLHFAENAKLQWPIVGNVLLNYSMDKTIYFPTLQQYKYNPSIVIASSQGTDVTCAADGVVKAIYDDPQTGNTVIMNLGDGFELTYGQLEDIAVEQGELVETGVLIGRVAAPSKYYTVEGTNVYFKMTKDGEPVNPLDYLG